jgi:hypothetical protein
MELLLDAGRTNQMRAFPSEGPKLDDFQITIPKSQEMKRAAYTIRYDAYWATQGVIEHSGRVIVDQQDDAPHSTIHTLLYHGVPVGSIRTCVFSERFSHRELAVHEPYRKELESQLWRGKTLLESNWFVIHPSFRSRSLLHQFLLFRLIAINAHIHHADYVVTPVEPRHVAFYRRTMKFFPISSPKRYPGLNIEKTLIAADFERDMGAVAKDNRMLSVNDAEIEEYIACRDGEFSGAIGSPGRLQTNGRMIAGALG